MVRTRGLCCLKYAYEVGSFLKYSKTKNALKRHRMHIANVQTTQRDALNKSCHDLVTRSVQSFFSEMFGIFLAGLQKKYWCFVAFPSSKIYNSWSKSHEVSQPEAFLTVKGNGDFANAIYGIHFHKKNKVLSWECRMKKQGIMSVCSKNRKRYIGTFVQSIMQPRKDAERTGIRKIMKARKERRMFHHKRTGKNLLTYVWLFGILACNRITRTLQISKRLTSRSIFRRQKSPSHPVYIFYTHGTIIC